MTQMIIDFMWISFWIGLSLALFVVFIYTLTYINKTLLSQYFLEKGIKIKRIQWQPLKSQTFLSRKFYVVEYIKKDGRVCKKRLKSVLLF